MFAAIRSRKAPYVIYRGKETGYIKTILDYVVGAYKGFYCLISQRGITLIRKFQ